VLPDGRVLDQLTALRKDNTGYDLKQLFVGAEGTLGVVTAATLRLFPRPAATATAFAALPSPAAALELLASLREALGDTVTTFELVPRIALEFVVRHVSGTRDPFDSAHPWYALVEATLSADDPAFRERFESALAGGIERGTVTDAVTAASEAERHALWRLRETIPEAQRQEGASLKHDISVEPARLPGFIAEGQALVARLAPGARLVAYGHLGDGNLHYNLQAPADVDAGAFLREFEGAVNACVYDIVDRFGGTFSAEHGIGRLKREELAARRPATGVAMMRALKAALDPLGLLNPGVLLPERSGP
jgi:D-lactate dehydrogenase (cytochrome)